MKFSAEVSEAHAATRIKGPEAANIDNKTCIGVFQQLLWNWPWTQKMAFSHWSARRVATVGKRAANTERACTLCYLQRGSTLAN